MTPLGMEQLATTLRLAAIVAPVALYFFLLGVLNTRRRPQLLTARQDVAMLAIALSPIVFQPAMAYLGGGLGTLLGCVLAVAGLIWLATPRGRSWVIYNVTPRQGRYLLQDALTVTGRSVRATADGFEIDDGWGQVELGGVAVLRNLSFRFRGGQDAFWQTVETQLAERLERLEPIPSPAAVMLLLLATILLIAPLAMMAPHAPELVRLLTELP